MKLQIENRTRRDVSHSRSSKHQTIRRRVMLAEITVIKSRPNDSEETKREEKKKKEKRKEHHFYESICLLGGKKAFDSDEGYQ